MKKLVFTVLVWKCWVWFHRCVRTKVNVLIILIFSCCLNKIRLIRWNEICWDRLWSSFRVCWYLKGGQQLTRAMVLDTYPSSLSPNMPLCIPSWNISTFRWKLKTESPRSASQTWSSLTCFTPVCNTCVYLYRKSARPLRLHWDTLEPRLLLMEAERSRSTCSRWNSKHISLIYFLKNTEENPDEADLKSTSSHHDVF